MQILVNLYESVQNDEINTVEGCKYKAQDGSAGLLLCYPAFSAPNTVFQPRLILCPSLSPIKPLFF
jgi:hypothetical protein